MIDTVLEIAGGDTNPDNEWRIRLESSANYFRNIITGAEK
jgi:hypothetical protein